MTLTLLKNARWIYTVDPRNSRIENGYILIRDGRIAEISGGEAPDVPGADAVDCSGCIVLPGFINLHHHFFQAVTRAIPGSHTETSAGWLKAHYPLWSEINEDDLAVAAQNSTAELLLSGSTTSVDHAFTLRGAGSAMAAAEIRAVSEMGLRLHLVRGCLPTIGGAVESYLRTLMGDGIGDIIDNENGLIAQCRSDVLRWHDDSNGSMLRLALGPSNLPYDKPHLLRQISEIAEETGCGLHAHYHPRGSEREECQATLGCSPIEFLARSRWLRPGTWLAHCTELSDSEIATFAANGVGVAHCPRTVLRLGYQIPRIGRMRAAGVTVTIGVDGAAGNDGGSFISDLRLALLLHRCREQSPEDQLHWLTAEDALKMVTCEAAALLRRSDIGRLQPGMCADITAFDISGVDCAGSLRDPLAGFLLAGTGNRSKATIVNGRVVVRDGRLSVSDEEEIAVSTRNASQKLLDRTAARFGLAI